MATLLTDKTQTQTMTLTIEFLGAQASGSGCGHFAQHEGQTIKLDYVYSSHKRKPEGNTTYRLLEY